MKTENIDLLDDVLSQLDELLKQKPVDLKLGIQILKERYEKLQRSRKKSKQKILKLVLKLEEKIINELYDDLLLIISKIKEELTNGG